MKTDRSANPTRAGVAKAHDPASRTRARQNTGKSAPYAMMFGSPCACGGGCPKCQAKSDVAVSLPDDAAEVHATAVADSLMQSGAEERRASIAVAPGTARVERSAPTSNHPPPGSPDHVQSAIRGGGQPLDHFTREFFEPKLGFDLGGVRVHTGARAAQSARELAAKAYTIGNDVVFSAGRYQPGTSAGRHLLAHELAHVTQAGSSSNIQRETIYRDLDVSQIMTEIQALRMQLAMPVNPMRPQQQMRLAQLESMLSKVSGPVSPAVKPNPSIALPFEFRFSEAWDKAKQNASKRVRDRDSIVRGLMKIDSLVPSPQETWMAGRLAGLFKSDERDTVVERAEKLVSKSYKKRYEAAKYGHVYGDTHQYESGRRRDDPSEIWTRGRNFGLFFPDEKAQVLEIPLEGIRKANALNAMARKVEPKSPEAGKLLDEIHRFAGKPAVALLGPEIERLLGPYGYSYSDTEDWTSASFHIEAAYQKSLQGKTQHDPNAAVEDRWDEAQRRNDVGRNDLESARYDAVFFHSKSEFNREYNRRQDEYQSKLESCGGGPRGVDCREGVEAEYFPVEAARKYAGRVWAYNQLPKIDAVRDAGAIATASRLLGYLGARAFGADEDAALSFSENTAAVGSVGDAAAPGGAAAKRRADSRGYDARGGNVLTRADDRMTLPPSNVASPPKYETIPPPGRTATTTNTAVDSSVGTIPRNLDLAGKPPVPTTFGPASAGSDGSGGNTSPPAPKPVYPQTTGPLRMDFPMKYVRARDGDLTKEGIEFLKRTYPEKFQGQTDSQVRTTFQADRTGRLWQSMVSDEIQQHVPTLARGAKSHGQPFLMEEKSFNTIVTAIEKNVPGSVVDKAPLAQSFRQFIEGNPVLKKRAQELATNKNEALRNEYDTWINKNGDGLISGKRADHLEVIPSRKLAIVYDSALPVNSPFGPVHAFKTELYRQILLKITNLDVGAMDIGMGVIVLTGD